MFKQGNLLLLVINSWCDGQVCHNLPQTQFQAKFYKLLESYIKTVMFKSGLVVLGIFTQPYCKVEENEDVVNMYNRIMADDEVRQKGATSQLKEGFI